MIRRNKCKLNFQHICRAIDRSGSEMHEGGQRMSSSSNLSLAAPRNRRPESEQQEHGHIWNRHGAGIPTHLPYRQGEADQNYIPWRLFEDRVRMGPYALRRFPSQPYPPVRILIFHGTGGGDISSTVNPRPRQFIQNSPPRIRGEWQLHPEPEQSELTQDEFSKAMKKLKRQLYSPPNQRRRAWSRGLFSSRGSGKNGTAGDEVVTESRDCTICLETFVLNEQVLVTPCNHMFHHDCLVPWIRSHGQCPVCRSVLCERRRPDRTSGSLVSTGFSGRRGAGAGAGAGSGVGGGGDDGSGDEEMALELIHLIRAMEEAFDWINLSR